MLALKINDFFSSNCIRLMPFKPLHDGRLLLHFPFVQVSFADPTNVKFVRHAIWTSPPSFKVVCVMIPFFIESTTVQEAVII